MKDATSYAVYRIVCPNGEPGHNYFRPTVRHEAIRNAIRADDKCPTPGRHRIETAIVTQGEWGPLIPDSVDPQTSAREEFLRQAYAVACPRCDAKVGKPCVNLTVRKAIHEDHPTLWPHPARIEAAGIQ